MYIKGVEVCVKQMPDIIITAREQPMIRMW